jgi:hypothetical protein
MNFNRYTRLLAGEGDGGAGGGGAGSGDAGAAAAAAAEAAKAAGGGGDAPRHGWLKDDMSFEPEWQKKLPESMKEHEAMLANFKDFPTLAKTLKDSMTAARQKTEGYIKPITDASTPEEKLAYAKALGVPEKPEEYGLAKPADEGLAKFYDEATVAEFGKVAHELGLNKTQAAKLVEFQLNQRKVADEKWVKDGQEGMAAWDKELRETLGDKYDARMIDAKRVIMSTGGSGDMLPFLEPKLVVWLSGLATKLGEDTLVSREAVTNKLTPSSQAEDIVNNPANPLHKAYHDRMDPRNGEAVQMFLSLLQKAA